MPPHPATSRGKRPESHRSAGSISSHRSFTRQSGFRSHLDGGLPELSQPHVPDHGTCEAGAAGVHHHLDVLKEQGSRFALVPTTIALLFAVHIASKTGDEKPSGRVWLGRPPVQEKTT